MPEPSPLEIRTILVPVDFEEPSLHALAYARSLADRVGAALHLLHVVPNPYVANAYMPMPLPSGFLDDLVSDAGKRLQDLVAEQGMGPGTAAVVRVGDARTEILEQAAAEGADLVVIGTHGRKGAAHFLLGSVAEKVVRAASCPVLTVR